MITGPGPFFVAWINQGPEKSDASPRRPSTAPGSQVRIQSLRSLTHSTNTPRCPHAGTALDHGGGGRAFPVLRILPGKPHPTPALDTEAGRWTSWWVGRGLRA